MDSPVTAAQSGLPTSSRSTEGAVANIVTTVGNVPANAGPQIAGAANPGPSTATISRQSAPADASATRTQPSQSAQSNSPASQLARGGVARAAVSRSPTIDAGSQATGSPRRAVTAAEMASSPVAVESPARSISAAGPSDASADPGRIALARGQAGIAGGGESPNVDSSLPGGNSPALTASGAAARRSHATRPAGRRLVSQRARPELPGLARGLTRQPRRSSHSPSIRERPAAAPNWRKRHPRAGRLSRGPIRRQIAVRSMRRRDQARLTWGPHRPSRKRESAARPAAASRSSIQAPNRRDWLASQAVADHRCRWPRLRWARLPLRWARPAASRPPARPRPRLWRRFAPWRAERRQLRAGHPKPKKRARWQKSIRRRFWRTRT